MKKLEKMKGKKENTVKVGTVNDVFEQHQKMKPEGFLSEQEQLLARKKKAMENSAEGPMTNATIPAHTLLTMEAQKFTGKPKLTSSDMILDDDDVC